MNRTFASEDKRKTKLFEAWNEYLQTNPLPIERGGKFEELFEGIVKVSDISPNFLNIQLEDECKVEPLPINIKISFHSLRHDEMYMVLGLTKDKKWWPLDITSIGSIFDQNHNNAKVHMTVNPLLMENVFK